MGIPVKGLFCYSIAMLHVTKSLPEDPAELRAFTALLLAEVKSQAVLIEKLRHQLAGQRAHRFGASSETAEQLQLALEMSEIAIAAMTENLRLPDDTPADKPKRKPIPDHIPRIEVELPPGSTECAQCGGKLRRLGEDVTEELEYVPGRFIVNRMVRPRMACSGCDCFTQAPLPSRPIERGRPGPGLLAHVLVNKYADHLPLYRQSQIFDRDGLDIDRSTLADWVGKSTALMAPLADAIRCPAGDACITERGAACAGGASDLRRRHPRRDVGIPLPGRRLQAITERGHRQDPDGPALGLRPR